MYITFWINFHDLIYLYTINRIVALIEYTYKTFKSTIYFYA